MKEFDVAERIRLISVKRNDLKAVGKLKRHAAGLMGGIVGVGVHP
jgi:hypothetical protein